MDTQDKENWNNELSDQDLKELDEAIAQVQKANPKDKDTGDDEPDDESDEEAPKDEKWDDEEEELDDDEEEKKEWDEDDSNNEEWKKSDDSEARFKKQSANAQRKIQEKDDEMVDRVYNLTIKDNPEKILELAQWSDNDVKLAKKIARRHYKASLEQVVEEFGWISDEDLSSEEKAEKIAQIKIKQMKVSDLKSNFEQNNEILDKDSKKFNKQTFEAFQDTYARLIWNESYATDEEVKDAMDKALLLTNREAYEAKIRQDERGKIQSSQIKKYLAKSSGGWWGWWDRKWWKSSDNPFEWIGMSN